MSDEVTASFEQLGLPSNLLNALKAVGYESPSPIQAATIPPLLKGRDLLGQAQTGTGKTAAFALPALANIDVNSSQTQVLVLTPTRELAIQVAEAFQRYAQAMPNFHVLPVYGGQGYRAQLMGLQRGAHVVVGTPGRIQDHLERGTLNLSTLKMVVLDEADEMLRMGFIEAVENILSKTPERRQVALFSATMPAPIKRIANRHLNDPVEIAIKSKTSTATKIRQRYWLVTGLHKLDALTRILEAENFDAMIIFARTKQGTEELAERLQARGFQAAAINGDLQQIQREKTIARLKDGQLDILVATDVAARGLDVERISHVINFDIPYDSEAYVHRIGRTGRAGRSGDAILFVTPRERHLLRTIERATRQPIEAMVLPSIDEVNDKRIARFFGRITEALSASEFDTYLRLVERYLRQHEESEIKVAAALMKMVQGDRPLLLNAMAQQEEREAGLSERKSRSFDGEIRSSKVRGSGEGFQRKSPSRDDFDSKPRRPRDDFDAKPRRSPEEFADKPARTRAARPPQQDLELFRVEVGHRHGVKPGQLVGAITGESGLSGQHMGRIEIYDDHSTVELPKGMPKEIFQHLKKVRVTGQPLKISRVPGSES
jgi:ATP-dependent RNA helicase DeaD